MNQHEIERMQALRHLDWRRITASGANKLVA
jgi:hypothetical protein